MKTNEYRNQHRTAPKAYYARWRSSGASNGIFDYDKNVNWLVGSRGIGLRRIEAEKDAWHPEVERDYMSPKDDMVLKTLRDLLESPEEVILNRKKDVIGLICNFMARSKKVEPVILEYSKRMEESRMISDQEYIPRLDLSTVSLRSEVMKNICDDRFFKKVQSALEHYICRFGINRNKTQLITSDSPTVYEGIGGNINIGFFDHIGVAPGKGTKVVMPLSPESALILYDNICFSKEKNKSVVFMLGKNKIKKFNKMQMLQSYRYIYFRASSFNSAKATAKKIRSQLL